MAAFLDGINGILSLDQDSNNLTGIRKLVETFQIGSIYSIICEYIQYPMNLEWIQVSKAAYNLLATLSGFDQIKGLVIHHNIHAVITQALSMSKIELKSCTDSTHKEQIFKV